jgi:chromosome segregation ATPase
MEEQEKNLEDLLADETASKKVEEPKEKTAEELEVERLATEKDNLARAIEEAKTELRAVREEKSKAKGEEEELPKIDFEDPSAKAWANHISKEINPVQQELDKEKEEIRTFALKKFLAEKPTLAANTAKLKEVIDTYEKIRTCSERTQEGVMLDFEKAYGAVFAEEEAIKRREDRIREAEANREYSEPGVSYGATGYKQERQHKPNYDPDTAAVVSKWDKELSDLGYDTSKF